MLEEQRKVFFFFFQIMSGGTKHSLWFVLCKSDQMGGVTGCGNLWAGKYTDIQILSRRCPFWDQTDQIELNTAYLGVMITLFGFVFISQSSIWTSRWWKSWMLTVSGTSLSPKDTTHPLPDCQRRQQGATEKTCCRKAHRGFKGNKKDSCIVYTRTHTHTH